ncbi:hypothetical protein BB561_006616 [Smittium simulii]|uniref:MYND-type domain-containing protein n=1 Tax=Smittium simulii TaxID=133385 RepID=A0A2T9Y2R9_9FUNG|nr:hypothetical protein BB561_006616 [Smittium simulii]
MADTSKSNPVPILGFIEDDMYSPTDAFVSKVGGTPNWLHYTQPLNSASVTCKNCKEPMILLLQLYAPEDIPAQAYHRVLYLFTCRNGKCHRAGFKESFSVLRSQLSKENEYYTIQKLSNTSEYDDKENEDSYQSETEYSESETDESYENTLRPGIIEPKLCIVCGLSGTHSCSKCKNQYYCSKEHQLVDWTLGQHKTNCDYEILSETEVITKAKKTPIEGTVIGKPEEDELDEDSIVEVDKPFLDFQQRISHNPTQILRYARNADYDKDCEPLWVNSFGKPSDDNIPKCELCGSERTFEFQVMPQLLNYLNLNHSQKEGIDWGTLLIYTCPKNCETDKEYKKEFIWRQNFSTDGIGNRYAKAAMNMLDESDLGLDTMNI